MALLLSSLLISQGQQCFSPDDKIHNPLLWTAAARPNRSYITAAAAAA
jgi:hypothetical protein